MTTLTIRKLQVDLSRGFDRHWHGGDAFRSQYYNALSMSFPVGEQSFIDAVREGLALLPDTPEHAALRADVAQFIGQEATHRHVHGLYNEQLEKQGLVNRWQDRATRRIEYGRAQKVGPLHLLGKAAGHHGGIRTLHGGVCRRHAALWQLVRCGRTPHVHTVAMACG